MMNGFVTCTCGVEPEINGIRNVKINTVTIPISMTRLEVWLFGIEKLVIFRPVIVVDLINYTRFNVNPVTWLA